MKMKELAKAFSKFSNAEQESLHRLFIQVFFYFIYFGISCPKFIITVSVINYSYIFIKSFQVITSLHKMVEVCMHFFCIFSADLCFSFYYILLNGLDSVRAQQ
jgi:hypothetical protein